MPFEYSEKSSQLQQRLSAFMQRNVYPNEAAYAEQLQQADDRFAPLPLMELLKQEAKAEGLWNLFVPETHAEFSEHARRALQSRLFSAGGDDGAGAVVGRGVQLQRAGYR
jgi:alkylation response protein AidB-like acyl-CoA dehydrogenase